MGRRILADRALTTTERKARWRANNPASVRALRRRYRERHREQLNAKSKEWAAQNREKHTAYMRRYRAENISRWLWSTAKKRAKRYAMDFTIEQSDIIVPAICPVLGIPISIGERTCHDGSPTLDRKDNSRGYVKGNVIVVSWRANTIKSSATPVELRRIADFYEGV